MTAGLTKPSTTAIDLFRRGMDTVDIARELGVTESHASRMVHEQRSREKGFPVEYERRVRGEGRS